MFAYYFKYLPTTITVKTSTKIKITKTASYSEYLLIISLYISTNMNNKQWKTFKHRMIHHAYSLPSFYTLEYLFKF